MLRYAGGSGIGAIFRCFSLHPVLLLLNEENLVLSVPVGRKRSVLVRASLSGCCCPFQKFDTRDGSGYKTNKSATWNHLKRLPAPVFCSRNKGFAPDCPKTRPALSSSSKRKTQRSPV
ncbi:hypothetical protein pipiens_006489 [Culex pipiens pipiens]|uniref:Secreted protein n=1 Tax=Culex pipiens pipiens TaxID=38569 RepID=A0ABD1DTC2_CULPP